MALTPEQIAKLRIDAGLSPELPSQESSASSDIIQSRLAEFDQAIRPKTPVQDVGVGIAKGALSTVKGAGTLAKEFLGNKAKNSLLGKAVMSTLPEETKSKVESVIETPLPELIEENKDTSNVAKLFSEENLEPTNTAEKIGKTGEQIAEYVIPGTKVAKATERANLLTKIGSRALTSGAVGAAQSGEIGKDAAIAAGTEIIAPGVANALPAIGRLVSKTGSKLVEAVIPTSAKEAQILQTYKANKPFLERISDVIAGTEKAPTTAGKTAVTTTAGQTLPGLFGTKSGIGVQAKKAASSLWNDVISPRLKAAPEKIDLDSFFAKAEKEIIANNPEMSRQKALLEALDSVKEDYSGIQQISLEKLQDLKKGWAKFVPDKAYKGKPIAGAFNEVRADLASEARDTIYKLLGDDVKQAYFDYGNLIGLEEFGQTAMTGSKLKGGAGSFIYEIASQAVTPVATVGGQVVYRIGKGIEMIGEPGAKTVGDILGIGKAAAIKGLQGASDTKK